jgi:hypothetical protein
VSGGRHGQPQRKYRNSQIPIPERGVAPPGRPSEIAERSRGSPGESRAVFGVIPSLDALSRVLSLPISAFLSKSARDNVRRSRALVWCSDGKFGCRFEK